MPSNIIQDLTGKVKKTEDYYFAAGGNADIWKGGWVKTDRGRYIKLALKIPRLRQTTDQELAKVQERLSRETKVVGAVSHRNIAPLIGIAYDLDRPGMACLVFPFYRNGNILSYLEQCPNVNRVLLITQIASALSYLHGLPKPIVHGDIKPDNMLVNDDDEAILADFGLSRILETSGFTTKTRTGTWRFMAPELHSSDVSPSQLVTQATDVWAFAMTVLQILTGRQPFSHIVSDTAFIYALMARRDRPKWEDCKHQVNEDIWGMLEKSWDQDPTNRPSMAVLFRFFALQLTTCAQVPLQL